MATLESAINFDLPSTPFLRALQSAFIKEQAAQCGYCTSGMLISATALLMNAHGTISDLQIREALEPHLCRCGTHKNESVVDALGQFENQSFLVAVVAF
jgi:aerobic-type carbon monoxide dehydrogenase small subunit (CoxS/CutS family)